MFQLHAVSTSRIRAQLSGGNFLGNRVHVITGPNGSGKTDFLTVLALHYRFGPQPAASIKASRAPDRVIAQTFSPFSRFPSAARTTHTISETYTDEKENEAIYEPVGFHKSLRHVGGSFSRHVLEEAIFRLSENVERTYTLGRILEFLSFKRQISFSYASKPALRELLDAQLSGDLIEFLETSKRGSVDTRRLASEVKLDSSPRVAELLESAIDVLGQQVLRKRISHEVNFEQSRPESYAKLQALTVLRRYGLLRLDDCTLFHPLHGRIDLSFASSGQQQLLCSLFGIASAIKDNSLVLIDEPELSLHPRWQMAFLEHLAGLLRAVRGCHVLIATHSPLIVQRAQEMGLGMMEMGEELPETTQSTSPNQHTPSVEETLIDVFDAPLSNSLYLGNELIRLINTAHEEGPAFAAQARSRLEELRKVYAESAELQLIEKAMRVVNIDVGA